MVRRTERLVDHPVVHAFLAGGGPIGALVRAHDWASTPVGPPETWPAALRSTLRLVLNAAQPMCLFWGPEALVFFNDPYDRSFEMGRMSSSLGRSARAAGVENWDLIAPEFERIMAGKPAARVTNDIVPSARDGEPAPVNSRFSCNPVFDVDIPERVLGVLVIFNPTTGSLLDSERLESLLHLEDSLQPLDDPRAVMRTACETLGLRLAVDRVGYAEIDGSGEIFNVHESWAAQGMRSGSGDYRADDFGLRVIEALRAGRAVVFNDMLDDPLTAASSAVRAFRKADIRGAINLPLVRGGRLVANLFVHSRKPREWTTAEREFVKDVAHRTWSAVERARAQSALQESEARFRAVQEASIDGYMSFAPARNELGTMIDFRWLYVNAAAARLFNRSATALLGRFLLRETPGHRQAGLFDEYVKVVETGEPWTGEFSYRHDGIDRSFRNVAVKTGEGLTVTVVDITERLGHEQRLRDSEQKFRAAVDAVQGILWTNDAAGRMTDEQPGWESLTGQNRADYEGFGWTNAVHPEDVEPTVTAWNAAVAEKRTFKHEHRLRRRNGEWREFSIRAVPVFDQVGAVSQWVGVHTDVTEQRIAERSIKHEQNKLQTVIDTVPAAVLFTHDNDARRVIGNKYAAKLLQLPLKSETGMLEHTGPLVPSIQYIRENRPMTLEQSPLLRAARGDEVKGEQLTLVFQDGSSSIIEIHAKPMRDEHGRLVGAVSAALDITDRKAAEAKLRQSEEEFRALADNQANICWMARPDGSVYWYNLRWYEYTGTTFEDMRGWGWESVVDPAVLPSVIEGWTAAIQNGTALEMTFPLRAADGTFREFLTQVVPLRDASGTVVRWFGTNVDITEQRAIEESLRDSEASLRRLNDELEERVVREVEAREQAFTRSAHAHRMEALGQLAGGVAHDFNNVLQAMTSGLSLIARRAEDPAAVTKLSRMALDASGRGAAITNRLLTFARSGQLNAGPVEARAMLEPLRELLAATLDRNLMIELSIEKDAPALIADKAQLETVLINLAVNARDAMSDGGRLTLGWTSETVKPGSSHPASLLAGPYIRLDVTDSGDGMDADTLKRASDPFFTTKPVGQGTGLGLAMARGFAQQSGGGLVIESQLGVGTRVTLWLPQASNALSRAPDSCTIGSVEFRSIRALVVDDDPMVLAVLTQQLDSLGFVTTRATDGLDALDKIESGVDPQILITDYAMPGMNGASLIEEVRRRRPDLPALLLTGFADTEALTKLEAARDGITGLRRKPISHDDLALNVGALLDFAASQRALEGDQRT